MARKAESTTTRKAPRARKATPAKAVSKASGKKPPAKRAPRKLAPLHTSAAEDALALEAQNRRYYDTFQSLELEEIAKVWWHDSFVTCIHPGWDLRQSWEDVKESYEEIFQNTRSIRFALGEVHARVVGDLGYVTCVENLVSEEGDSGDYLGAVLATNVFERRHGEWRIVHHHASPFTGDEDEIPEGPLH